MSDFFKIMSIITFYGGLILAVIEFHRGKIDRANFWLTLVILSILTY